MMTLAFRNIKILSLPILSAYLAFAIVGCEERTTPSEALVRSSERHFTSQIAGYNHTDKPLSSFSVNGAWGGSVWPHANGGDTCCLQLPLPWPPGLKVKIDWEDDHGQHTRDILVPEYSPKSIGIFNVHFLRTGEIKVFEINAVLGHPDYPLRGEEANLKPGVPNFQFPREVPVSN